MAKYCSECKKKLGFMSMAYTIRGKDYCYECSRFVPSCDKCEHHTNYTDHEHGECQFHQQWLQDYDNTCEHYCKK